MTQRTVAAIRLIVASCCLTAAGTGAAEVKLENTVMKVAAVVNELGVAERHLVDADSVLPGDELRYTILFNNDGTEVVDAQSIVITNPIPADTEYLEGTASGLATEIVFSVDGETFARPEELRVVDGGKEVQASAEDYRSIRWTFQPPLAPGESSDVSFNVLLH